MRKGAYTEPCSQGCAPFVGSVSINGPGMARSQRRPSTDDAIPSAPGAGCRETNTKIYLPRSKERTDVFHLPHTCYVVGTRRRHTKTTHSYAVGHASTKRCSFQAEVRSWWCSAQVLERFNKYLVLRGRKPIGAKLVYAAPHNQSLRAVARAH